MSQSVRSLSPDIAELALRVYEGIGGPRSVTCAMLLRAGEFDQLANLVTDPVHYNSSGAYGAAATATNFLRKFEPLPTTVDRAAMAERKWYEGELECFRTNQRLWSYLPGCALAEDFDPKIAEIIGWIKHEMLMLLGHNPSPLADGRHGPGTTFTDRGENATIPHKMSSSSPALTSDAVWYLPQWLGNHWGAYCASHQIDPVFVKGNRFTTAPKDATKDRAIAVEPSINVFYQLALGGQIRSRLKAAGIDLRTAQNRHREIAKRCSITGDSCTLDLSNASDTVSSNLVKLLLPPGWYEALSSLRSPRTLIKGNWVVLEKFSSMGNGFTFELETAIFASIARVGSFLSGCFTQYGKDVLVYGDDIIVPTTAYRTVKAMLAFFGFTLNEKKSFHEGPFRESCGGDYFAGQPVRGYFLKNPVLEPQHWIAVANGLYEANVNLQAICDPNRVSLNRARAFCLAQIPRGIRLCTGPKDLGDIVIREDDESRWGARWRYSIRYVRCYRPVKFRKVPYDRFHPDIVLACAVYGLGWGDGAVTRRSPPLGYKVGWVPHS